MHSPSLKIFLYSLLFLGTTSLSFAGMTAAEFDDYAHLSLGADVLPYDWWIRLKSARERDISPTRTWDYRVAEKLDQRASMLYDKSESKYLSGVVGLSVTWSGQDAKNPDALKSDPETAQTKIGEKAPIRFIKGGVPSIRMLGTTCAGCHTGNLRTTSDNHWIPGGQGNLSLDWLLRDMVISTLALTIDFEGQLAEFLISFGYSPDQAKEIATDFKKTTLKETKLSTKLILGAKKFGIIKSFPGWGFVKEEKNIGNRLKALLRLTLHLPENGNLGEELNQRMDFIAKLASGTPRKTFQDNHWMKFTEVTAGYGRVDAFINAFNRVLRDKKEKVSISAPVGFPPVWGIQHKYLVHYTGNTNSVTHRNIGLAVAGGALIMDEDFNSTVKFDNLMKLEKLMYKLDVPDWQKIFASETSPDFKINVERATRGQALFKQECASCHTPMKIHNEFIYPLHEYPLLSQKLLGTDPELAIQIAKPIKPLTDEKSYPAKMYLDQTDAVMQAYFKKYAVSSEARQEFSFRKYRGEQFFRDVSVEVPGSSYISRDLAGIWATAPFLHNNSVPTLWDLLQKAEKRPKLLRVKHRGFDPVKVGLKDYDENPVDCYPWEKKQEFKRDKYQCIDTTVVGSSNAGHEFGTDLKDEEKWDLIEYLKVLEPQYGSRSPASEQSKQSGTPFLDDFDDIKVGKIPLIGQWLEAKDFLKHKVLTFKKWLKKDPKEMFEELRDLRPVAFMSKLPVRKFSAENEGLVLLSKHQDIVEVLDNPGVFSVRHVGYKLDEVGGHMLGTDLTAFNTVEKPWLRKIIPHTDYERISKLIQKYTDESFQIAEKKQKGAKVYRMNLVNDLARRVPGRLFEEYFGFPGPNMDYLYKWSYWIQRDTFVNPMNQKSIRKKGLNAELELLEYMNVHIQKLEKALAKNGNKPIHDTVLERMLLSEEVQNGTIKKDRIAINMIGLLGASIETIQMAVVKSLEFFTEHPELWNEARSLAQKGNSEQLQAYVIESLRLHPVGPLLLRYTERETTIAKGTPRETVIPKGTSILLGIYSAMRDPEVVNDPEEFKPGRPENNYFTFGYGHHRCAGDRLGKVEVSIMMSALLQKQDLKYFNSDKKGLPFPEERWIEYRAF